MRHLHKGRKLNKTAPHRRAMFNNMLVSIIKEESIHTTDAKAKELRGLVDKLITYAKKNTNATVRQAKKYVKDKEAFKKLFNEFPDRFESRVSGYTRIIKYKNRKGDNAPISIIEFVDYKRPTPLSKEDEEEIVDAATETVETAE
jgi:large subunit ribosomal protein L17